MSDVLISAGVPTLDYFRSGNRTPPLVINRATATGYFFDPVTNTIVAIGGGGGGGGTVTSIGVSSTGATLSISGSPVTGSGVINADLNLGHHNEWTATQNVAESTLTDAAAITPNGSASNNFYLLTTSAIGATRTLHIPSGLNPKDMFNLEVKQPASGGPCAVVFDATQFNWGLGGLSGQPPGSTAANASDFYSFTVLHDGTARGTLVGQAGPAGANGVNAAGNPTDIAGRLTLTSGAPLPTTDVAGATTIYWSPYKGNNVVLWNGSAWQGYTSAEISVAIGTVTSGNCHDVFMFQNSGVPTLEYLAWTNATTRATTVTLQDGRYCKSTDKTRLYLGTFYSTSTTATADSAGGTTTQVGGQRFLWNYYNRVLRPVKVKDTTATWTYNTNTIRQANAAAGNKVEMVIGITEDVVYGSVVANVEQISGTTTSCVSAPGLDSTTTFSSDIAGGIFNASASAVDHTMNSLFAEQLAVGYHFVAWNERGGNGTVTWVGNSQNRQSGLTLWVMC